MRHFAFNHSRRRIRRQPVSLVEVMIGFVIAAIMIHGTLSTLMSTRQSVSAASMHTSAVSMCTSYVEKLRAMNFDQITSQADKDADHHEVITSTTPNTDKYTAAKSLTHTQSKDKYYIEGERIVLIQDVSNPPDYEAKKVTVKVKWDRQGREQEKSVQTIIYNLEESD